MSIQLNYYFQFENFKLRYSVPSEVVQYILYTACGLIEFLVKFGHFPIRENENAVTVHHLEVTKGKIEKLCHKIPFAVGGRWSELCSRETSPEFSPEKERNFQNFSSHLDECIRVRVNVGGGLIEH